MEVLIAAGVFIVLVIVVGMFLISASGGAAKAIKALMHNEVDRLEKMKYEELKAYAEQHPATEIDLGGKKLKRILTIMTTTHDADTSLTVEIVLRGIKDASLEEAARIVKRKGS